jgi:hypothetical protein
LILEHKVDTIYTLDQYVSSHLEPMDTICTKGVLVCGHQEVVAMATSKGALTAAGGGMRRR